MNIQHSLVLCKNYKSARLLYDRYINLCRMNGEDFISDPKYLSVRHPNGYIIRFVSSTRYYNEVSIGNDAAIIIGDKEFDRRLDEAESELKKDFKGDLNKN